MGWFVTTPQCGGIGQLGLACQRLGPSGLGFSWCAPDRGVRRELAVVEGSACQQDGLLLVEGKCRRGKVHGAAEAVGSIEGQDAWRGVRQVKSNPARAVLARRIARAFR